MVRSNTPNILGELTAETDSAMLKSAFYESPPYRALLQASDIRFVVGRRGTGKSALFSKVSESLENNKLYFFIKERPEEEYIASLRAEVQRFATSYLHVRWISRVAWRCQILTQAAESILGHYKSDKIKDQKDLLDYQKTHEALFKRRGISRSLAAIRTIAERDQSIQAEKIPAELSEHFELGWLNTQVTSALEKLGKRIIFVYDGLDEGWIPDQVGTGIIGGLAKAATEFVDSQAIHCLLFVRDNMFRAMAQLDDDFSRNIEGNTLRLHWDSESLLHLVALRLRIAFGVKVESNVKMWERFAQRDLEGKVGFEKCLHLTSYRPRDVIALLNGAHQVASHAGRTAIIGDDIEKVATQISKTRLGDLYKEYNSVFPGLPLFAEEFRGGPARMKYGQVLQALEKVAVSQQTPQEPAVSRNFSLLASGADAFDALYSVGFIGMIESDGRVRFCHDGSNADTATEDQSLEVVFHPCYWRALDLKEGSDASAVNIIDDEDDETSAKAGKMSVKDIRQRKLGTVIADLGKIKTGKEHAPSFERWVYDSATYLFANGLENIVQKPNPNQIQQRDIVGTIREPAKGFWKRMLRDYEVRQMTIEVKNFEGIAQDEFRQAWSYLQPPYGRCMILVTRTSSETPTARERALVMEGYHQDPKKLVLIFPAELIHRMMRKMQREENRDDYIEEKLSRRLDRFEREFVHQPSSNAHPRNRRRL